MSAEVNSSATPEEARAILTALKSGVVPRTRPELLLAGRKDEMVEFSRCLQLVAEGNGVAKFIVGDYGSGKSFLLQRIHQQAVRQNFIVSRLSLQQGFRLNKWEDFYSQMMHNLSVKSLEVIDTGFEEMFQMWIDELRSPLNRDSANQKIAAVINDISQYNGDFARAFLSYIRSIINHSNDTALAAASWIKGETNMPAALKATFGIKGHIDRSNALLFLKTFVRLACLMQYKGQVILVDELESALNQRSDIRNTIYDNLRFIVDGCASGEFANCLFVFVSTDQLIKNEQAGLLSCEPLAQRLRIDKNFNQTGVQDLRQPVMRLALLDIHAIDELTKKVLSLYKTAWDWQPSNSWASMRNWALFQSRDGNELQMPMNTRRYVQNLTDICDMMLDGKPLGILSMPLRLVERDGKYLLKPGEQEL